MSQISNSQRFNTAFLPPILLEQTDDDIQEALRQHCLLSNLVRSMRSGDMNPEELLEAAEPFISDMDGYADYVEQELGTIEHQWQL